MQISKSFLLIIGIFSTGILFANVNSEEHQKLVSEGLQFYYQKRYAQATQSFDRAISGGQTDTVAFRYYAESYAKSLSAILYIERARKFSAQNRLNQALSSIDRAEEISPYSPGIKELREQIKLQKAKSDSTASLSDAERESYGTNLSAGQELLDSGRYAESMNAFSLALSILPGSVEATEGFNEAQKRYKGAMNNDKLAKAFSQAESLEKQKRLAQALSRYEEILRIDPGNSRAVNRRLEITESLRQQREIAEKNQMAGEYLLSGKEYTRRQEYDSAVEQFSTGKGLLPGYTDWDKLIQTAISDKKEMERRVYESKLKEIDARFQSGIVNLATERFKEAIGDFESVATIAKLYSQEETYKQAQDLLIKAKENLQMSEEEKISPDSPYYNLVETLTALGLNSYRQKDYEGARKYFAGILELFPKNKFANQYFLSCSIQLQPSTKEKIIGDLITQLKMAMAANSRDTKRLYELTKSLDPEHPELKELGQTVKERITPLKKPELSKAETESLYSQAMKKAQTNPKEAITILKKLIVDDQRSARARSALARLEGRLSQSTWQKPPIRINPEAQEAYARGLLHYNNGRIPEAYQSFQKAVQIAPDFRKAKVAMQKCQAYLNT